MAPRTAVEDEQPGPSQCWCCGAVEDPARLVHLGNHPEVVVCIRCANALSIRRLRKTVVRRGWHHNKIVGRALRRLGRFAP